VVSILVTTPIVRMSLHPLARISARIKLMDIDALGERLDTASAPDEVRVVIDCLNGLLDRLHDAFQRERAFSANVAHELRTPLAGLRSTIDVALAKPVESADYRRSLQRCLTICKQAESLTENLLMLARLDANQCQLQPDTVLLDDLLRKAWASVASRADSRGLEVVWSLGEQLELTTDAALLSLILRNLFDNAVSYADQGSRIEADASIAQGVATINVRNAAARLPQDLAQRVFDRFWRADASRSGNGEHAGLGLALCREAARVLDGQLTVNVQDERFTAGLQLHQQISRSKKQA
jgi:two-component system sensor histidine kinase QseC